MDMDDAMKKVEDWRREYNEVRPHSAIGDRTPMSLIQMPPQPVEAPQTPEISHLSRSKIWDAAKQPPDSQATWIRVGGNVTPVPEA